MFHSLWDRHHQWLCYIPWLLLLAVFIAGLLGDQGVFELYKLSQERQKLAVSIKDLESRNRTLRREVYFLKNDKAHLEKMAREELGLVKPGEIVYQFQD